MENKTDRRSFFSIAGKGTIGAMILSSLPFKLFASNNSNKKIKKVVIHQQAVKRVNNN